MRPRFYARHLTLLTGVAATFFGNASLAWAQAGGRGAPETPRTAQAAAQYDITGYWVSVVTEDWRFRMVTPPKGDYTAVFLNAEGRKIADAWDPAKDDASGKQCRSYGAPNILRMPGRIHITWQDDQTLKIETDAGQQTRMFHFCAPQSQGEGWQGISKASWDAVLGGRGQAPVGSLKVVTTSLKPGYLRKNGVPYSASAVLTEYLDRANEPNGDAYLLVTATVEDPLYLSQPCVTASHFRKQANGSGWNPTPCSARQCAEETDMNMKNSAFILLLVCCTVPTFPQQIPAQNFAGRTGQPTGIDLSGFWFPNPRQDSGLVTAAGSLVEYGGLPVNEAGRLYALAWSAARIQGRQHQCMGYAVPYTYNQPGNLRFWEERDPTTQRLVAIKMYWQISEGSRTIWMDDRPHPPAYAQHTWSGFSTGRYEGNALVVHTTHLKRAWIRANGIPQSDEATLDEHFIRHGDQIMYFAVVNDPVYLAEPFSRTYTLIRAIKEPDAWLYACDDAEQIVGKREDQVEAYTWGQHPFLREFSDKLHIPLLGTLGGPETMYSDFLAKVKDPSAMDAAVKAELAPSPESPHASRAADPNPHDGEIHVSPVQGNLYMLVGDGGNIAVQVGNQGPLVVDAGAGQLTDKVVAAIQRLSEKPIQFIVNTSFLSGHTGGNLKLRAAGRDPSLEGSFFSGQFPDAGRSATIIAHQNVENHLIALQGFPADAWPTDTFLRGRRRKYHNGEAVEIFHQPNAVTDGDSIVQFRRSDVIATGEIFTTTSYPVIDLKNGGSLQGEITALNDILDKTVFQHDEEGGTLIIPGRGRLCDEWEVAEYRDMLAIIRDRVQALVNKGATLQQVKAARVSADYDDRFGANSGPWTTEMFVEAVYTSLKNPPKAASKN